MVSINVMHKMDSGFTVHYPSLRKKLPYVGRYERVKESNLDVRKREIEAEGREFL